MDALIDLAAGLIPLALFAGMAVFIFIHIVRAAFDE